MPFEISTKASFNSIIMTINKRKGMKQPLVLTALLLTLFSCSNKDAAKETEATEIIATRITLTDVQLKNAALDLFNFYKETYTTDYKKLIEIKRERNGASGRTQEIQRLIGRSLRAIVDLKTEAQKEFFNHGLKSFKQRPTEHSSELFYKTATNKGVLLRINDEFPLLKSLKASLNSNQKAELNFILKMSSNLINKVRQVDNIQITGDTEKDGISTVEIVKSIKELLNLGLIKDRGYKGELFDLTKEGWDAFDQLKTQLKENQ